MSTQIDRISELAKEDPKRRFFSIAHLITPEALYVAFQGLRKKASAGVVLSGRLQYLAEVAQSPNAREGNDVGEVHPIPSSPSLIASVDYASLAMCGESCLRNPLRGNPHGGICEGRGRWCCHGRPKRARSWKRPIQPRNT